MKGRFPVAMALAMALVMLNGLYAQLWAAESAPALDQRSAMRGKILFIQCRACHATRGDEGAKIGPSLIEVFGRTAGTLKGYTGYSTALQDSAIVWDENTLDEWLQNPAGIVPGNLMAFGGMANEADRALLIRYLRTITAADSDAP